jgi:hypothetical protein
MDQTMPLYNLVLLATGGMAYTIGVRKLKWAPG